jgi:biopolymer transport protein ExbD/biopolymer transport protein TolR
VRPLPPRPPEPGQPPRPRRLVSRRHAKGGVRAEINVTPLVDVVLVLLIIFMVITPMIARGVAVELPITANHEKKADDNKDLVVSVTAEGDVYLGADKIALDRLTTAVKDERRRNPDKGIFFKADHRARYGPARRAMEAIHRAGVEDVQLGTDEKREGGK